MRAHSTAHGRQHDLVDHLLAVGELARGFGQPFGAGELAYWIGLVHDCGKASCAWQTGLTRAQRTGRPVNVDHKSLGVRLALAAGAVEAAFAVHGHHGGLVDQDALQRCVEKNSTTTGRSGWAEAQAALAPLLPGIFQPPPVIPAVFAGSDERAREFLVRVLFSCLVDADALDTQAHRLGLPGAYRGPDLDAVLLLKRLEARRSEYLAHRTTSSPMVDPWRNYLYEHALEAGDIPGGLLRLTGPTGTGKTMAGAAFALAHAAAHGKSRVIVALPFITVTEQNAQVFRTLLDPEDPDERRVVLEQHSQVDLDRAGRWQRLAGENWDAPFVVTTTVQLLESLFGRRPARMRKVHRLANAVIVLDEVQALPHPLLPQIADALRLLCTHFGSTVLLCSATQPELTRLGPLARTPVPEIVAQPARMFAALRRVRYRWWSDPQPTLAQVTRHAAAHPQVLVVLNAVKDARRVYAEALAHRRDGLVAHLSTAMCPAHRAVVLGKVRSALADGQPVLLASTPLVEAGLDVDFPVGYRAAGPPDCLIQVAGRVNREGHLGPNGGLLTIFTPVDGGMPKAYATQIGVAAGRFGPDAADLDNLQALEGYFGALYRTLNLGGPGTRSAVIGRNRAKLDFQAVTDGPHRPGGPGRDRDLAFTMIDDDTVPVVVAYQDGVFQHDWVTELRDATDPHPGMLRRLQPYTTTIRRQIRERPDVAKHCREVVGDLVEWTGAYDDAGLVLDPKEGEYIA